MSEKKTLVVTREGTIQGAVDDDVCVFKGIPYASPPVGELRWRKPEPVAPWRHIRQATEYGNASLQDSDLCEAIGGGDPGPLGEDCLYLNVWTPQLNEAAKMPVMVWIHGGGYVLGAGGLPPYVGAPLAKRGAVLVSINYRLGHLGFFAHPALDQEYSDGKVINNFALLDQIAALEWVQRNIAAFGGDPDNVTIFGQSAGGRSVLSLFASPFGTGLFHKGVAQSVYGLPDTPREDALKRGEAFATHFGKDGANATAAELRALDASQFWAIPAGDAQIGGPVAISGDAVLPEPILDVFENGTQALLPLIIGNTSDDSSVLADFGFSPADVIAALKEAGQYETVKFALYSGLNDDEELGRQVGRDLLFTTMSYLIAENHRVATGTSWRYYFDYVAEQVRADFPHGARHGDDICYVMDTGSVTPPLDEYFSAQDGAFAQNVSDYWFEFASSANNGSSVIAGVVEWPKHHAAATLLGKNKTMGFGNNSGDRIALEQNFMWLRVTSFQPTLKNIADLIPKEQEEVHSFQKT